MKMTQISDSTLKITISMNDLEERGMELADFLLPQEKTEDFFYSVLDEVDLPDHFKMSGMLSFRVTPKKDKIDILVTKSDIDTNFQMGDMSQMADFLEEAKGKSPEELLQGLQETLKAMGDAEALERMEDEELMSELEEELVLEELEEPEESDYVHFVLKFRTFTDMVAFAKSVNYPVEASEVYRYKDTYRMTVLLHMEKVGPLKSDTYYARMLEHAEPSKLTRAYLREHAELLREGDVVQELAGV